jgi:anti-anti-sigma regulatory factor
MAVDRDRRGWIGAVRGGSRGEGLRLIAVGEFDAADRAWLVAKLRAGVTAGHRTVDMDLSLVSFIDAAVVDVLLTTAQLATTHGCRFRVVHPVGLPAHVLDILDPEQSLGTRAGLRPELPDPGLRTGDHVCALVDGPAELRATMQAFVGAGLRLGDKCLCLLEDGSPVGDDGDPGQLEVHRSTDVYLPSGVFRPSDMLDYLDRTHGAAVEAPGGYRRVRAAGDMGWAVSRPPGADRLFEYESRVNDFAPRYPQMLLCLYDLSVFGGDVLPDLLRTHPKVLVGGRLVDSSSYGRPS